MKEEQLAEVKNIEAALSIIENAHAALTGIGDMMHPYGNSADEQLNGVHRSQAAAIFRFFGNALEEPVRVIENAKDRLEQAAWKGGAA